MLSHTSLVRHITGRSSRGILFVAFLAPHSAAVATFPVHALHKPHHLPADTVTSDSARLATITTDTGALAPGNRDFSRYGNPTLCRGAALWSRANARRSLESLANRLATLRHMPAGEYDTVGTGAAAATARACGAHFTVAQTASRDLDDFFQLALLEKNDSLAQAILAALVARAPTANERSAVRIAAIKSYLQAQPARTAAANALIAQIDSQGSAAYAERLQLHEALMKYFGQHYESFTVIDTVQLRREADRVLDIAHADHAMTPAQLEPMQLAYAELVGLAVFESPDSIVAVARRAQHDLSRFTTSGQATGGHDVADNVDWAKMPFAEVLRLLEPNWYYTMEKYFRKPAPRLQADAWFLPPHGQSADTMLPVPGKVNLICLGGQPKNYIFNLNDFSQGGAEVARNLTGWFQQYGPQGLVVTVVVRADSFFIDRLGNGDQIATLWPSPAQEANAWHWYYQTYEQLPFTLAVQRTHTTQWLPEPDGRRLTMTGPQFKQYELPGDSDWDLSGSCTVIDRNGAIMFTQAGDGYGRWEVGEMLRWLFTGPGAQNAAATPPNHATPVSSPSTPSASRGLSQ